MKPDDLLAITFLQKYPIDSARLLESMNSREAVEFLVTLPSEIVARVLQHTLPQTSLVLLESMPEKTVVDIVSYMSTTSAISILGRGEPSWQVGILGKLDTKLHATTLRALSFPDQSAGRLADPRVLLFTADRTVSDAILWVQKQPDYETDDLFIVDRQHALVGKVPMRSLLITDPDTQIEKIMTRHLDTIPATWTIDAVRDCPYWQASNTLPVIDDTRAFLGVIRYRTVRASTKTDTSSETSHAHVNMPPLASDQSPNADPSSREGDSSTTTDQNPSVNP